MFGRDTATSSLPIVTNLVPSSGRKDKPVLVDFPLDFSTDAANLTLGEEDILEVGTRVSVVEGN